MAGIPGEQSAVPAAHQAQQPAHIPHPATGFHTRAKQAPTRKKRLSSPWPHTPVGTSLIKLVECSGHCHYMRRGRTLAGRSAKTVPHPSPDHYAPQRQVVDQQ
ncbi:hypothetical protein GCM10010207_77750 [Streptomyces atratus]|nr:hypothetical protein GCM10010207_77750 [Streptomyces atratus]